MRTFVIILLGIIILTFIMTFPFFLNVNTAIPGFESSDEPYGGLWSLWWMRFSNLNHLSYNSCKMIAYPEGMDFSRSIVTYPLWDFLNSKASIIFNEVVAYNLNVILGFVLTGIFMYYFAYYFIPNKPAAFLSSLIFTFCPYHFIRAWQHIGLANTQWMVLYLFFFFKLLAKRNIKNLVFSLIGIYLVFSFDYYYAYFMVVATILIFFYWQIHRFFKTSRPNRIAELKDIFKDSLYTSLIMLFCFLIILPIIMRILNSHVTTSNAAWNMSRRAFEDLFSQSAKPLSYFLPSLQQPVLGGITGFFIGSELYGKSLTEHVLFLGWIPIILAIVAVRRWRVNKTYSRENFYIGLFTYLTFVFWIFSQPPWWQIGPLKIYMPSFFMYKFLPMFRAYCRFGILVMLGVSILAGFGIKFILSSFKNRFLAFIVYILFCVLILFEFWSYPPFKIIYVNRVPPVYSWLKAQPGLFVIAEYPLDIEAPNEVYKFYQTKHDKKMINGAFPGTPANKFLCNIADLSNPNTVGMLNNLGVKYVLVHSQDYQATGLVEDLKQLEEIKNNSSLRLVKDFNDGISVYEIVRNTK